MLNVGYQNSGLNAYGQLKTASFVNITQKDGVRLSDISVSGYADTEGGCWGGVSINMLDTDGSNLYVGDMVKNYYWYDEEGEYEAGWYDESEAPMKNDESVLGNAEDIVFDIGQGLWVMAGSEYEGCTINFNGEVYCPEVNYPLIAYGQLIGNPRPTSIKLSDIAISGYADTEGGCWGGVSINMLDTDGSNLYVGEMVKNYYWYDEEGEYEAGWYDESEAPMKDDSSVLGNADEIEFVAGQGLWFMAGSEYEGCTVDFPALILK